MNFWTGIIIGVFVGANIGIVITAILVASKRSDYESVIQADQYPLDEAVMDDNILTSVTRFSPDHPHSNIVSSHAQEFQNS